VLDVQGLHQDFGICKIFPSPVALRSIGLAIRD
jgi:hypothetical protein